MVASRATELEQFASYVKKGKTMSITLKQGRHEVRYEKLPLFAVRAKRGQVASEDAISVASGTPRGSVTHLERIAVAQMDLFGVAEHDLEDTTNMLRKAYVSDVVTHVYTIDRTGSPVIPTGTLTLQFHLGAKDDEKDNILRDYGLEILGELESMPHAYTVGLTRASGQNPLKIAKTLQGMTDVVSVAEPNIAFSISFKHVPIDTYYSSQWHLNNRGGSFDLKEGADVKAEQAWEISRGSREITVCVIDDGFDLDHSDLSGPDKVVHPRDFGQDDQDPHPVINDDNHGTSCAGVAIAEENGSGVVGLAPLCSFMPIRSSGWLTDQTIANMFDYAMNHGADVISCSWSAAGEYFPLTTKMHDAIHRAATQGRDGRGCVILFAAGNENNPLLNEQNGIHQGFALHPDVIAVAASNSLDKRSSYSNYGRQLDICAPSSGSPGRRVVTTDRLGAKGYSSDDFAFDFGGTSSSTPLAAGLAALILSVNDQLSSFEVRDIMRSSADKIDQDHGDYDASGVSSKYGHGRINTYRALEIASGRTMELDRVLRMEHRTNMIIRDERIIVDTIPFPLKVDVKELELTAEIRHTYCGDLVVRLFPPSGEPVTLHHRSGGNQHDLKLVFRSSNDEGAILGSLRGLSALGDWRLEVADRAKQDEGVLVSWGIAITYSSAG